MIGLDTNILVQLAFANHPGHRAAGAKVESQALTGEQLAVTAATVAEFLHVVTDPKRFDPPRTMAEAINYVEELLRNPVTVFLPTTPAAIRQALQWMRDHSLGRKRIIDTQIAATFHVSGVVRLLTSNPADFAALKVFEIVTP